jgi:hypothetical protein
MNGRSEEKTAKGPEVELDFRVLRRASPAQDDRTMKDPEVALEFPGPSPRFAGSG